MVTTIREIILENFMSHEYSRVQLKPGLNIICGPNGAGKSSILLGLSIALGQTYTERSKRLSDLIRRGKDLGRVSVVFDNVPQNGKRPIPDLNSDTVVLSRYLNKDGTYWHEINSKSVTKGEVLRFLRRLSINPDNMLIIMHQNMVDTFGAIEAKERLRLVEEAVGLREYREHILSAMDKLSHTLSEEESIRNLLEKAEETLRYWEGEYERFKRKLELEGKKRELEVEYAWSKCIKQEENLEELKSRMVDLKKDLDELAKDLERTRNRERELKERLRELEFEVEASYENLIAREKARTEVETGITFFNELKETIGKAGLKLPQSLKVELPPARRNLQELEEKIRETRSKIARLKGELEEKRDSYIDSRVRVAVLEFKRGLLEREIDSYVREIKRVRRELETLRREAEEVGGRVETGRKPQEILDELKLLNAQLMSLADVSSDVERMYLSYKTTLKELEVKARVATENRKRAIEELELRKKRWREELERLIGEVRNEYVELLKRVNADGDIRLANLEDVDEAGLELYVGFRGAAPHLLDAYVQSGGERTTAIMFFLLALQKQIKSPIRAIDEFETHLDPHNREMIFQSIVESTKGEKTQYIVITPGHLLYVQDVPNVVMVQNVAGSSRIKVVANA